MNGLLIEVQARQGHDQWWGSIQRLARWGVTTLGIRAERDASAGTQRDALWMGSVEGFEAEDGMVRVIPKKYCSEIVAGV